MYFQLASSNYSYIVEPYNFQLNAVNKTIHLTNFPSLLLFISLNTWASTWCIFPLTKSYFKLDHVYCQQNFWIFVHNSVQSLIKTREPPAPPSRSLCWSGWHFSPFCFARKWLPAPSHMCSVHFNWSVICNEIFDYLIFDGLIWSKSLINWSQSGHKKKNSPNTVKLIQKVLPRKEITCSSQKTHIIFRKTISLSLLSHNAIIHSWCTSFL